MNIVPRLRLDLLLGNDSDKEGSNGLGLAQTIVDRPRETTESDGDAQIELELETLPTPLPASNVGKPGSISEEEHALLLRNRRTRIILLLFIALTLLALLLNLLVFALNRRRTYKHPFGHIISLIVNIFGIVFGALQVACWSLRWTTDGNAVFFGGGVILFHFYCISGICLDYFINRDIFAMSMMLVAGGAQLALYVQYKMPNGRWISSFQALPSQDCQRQPS